MLARRYKNILIIKIVFLFLAFILSIFSFVGLSGQNTNPFEKKIVFVLDISNSMNIKDIEGNYGLEMSRLDAAKKLISDTLDKSNDYQFGLIIFTDHPNYLIPATRDKENFKLQLDGLTTNFLKEQGSDISKAITLLLDTTQYGNIGVVISDFGDTNDFNSQKDNLKSISDTLITKKIGLKLIGLGTNSGGEIQSAQGKNIHTSANDGAINTQYISYLAHNPNTTTLKTSSLSNLLATDITDTGVFSVNAQRSKTLELLSALFAILGI